MNLYAILFIISGLAGIACFVFSIYKSVMLKNNPIVEIDYKSFIKKELYLSLGFAVGLVAAFCFAYGWMGVTPKIYEILQTIIGGAIFAVGLSVFINSFIVHYYRKNLPQNLHKMLFRSMMIGFGCTVVFLFVTLNGFADYLVYPLYNGISIKEGFVRPGEPSNVAFYALCILSGALFVYFLCDHKFYMEYGKHGILESTFLVAFPAGILGARIFYVVGNFNVPNNQGGFDGIFDYRVFAIWEGGLTILGGAIMGIVVGVLWFIWRNKGYNILLALDVIVPTILIAQAIGRWGNFFNCEVHGLESDENLWLWLPRVVWQNAHWSTANGYPTESAPGTLFVPLFFIESIINLVGFGVLGHLFGVKLRKYTALGDIGLAYVIWYGLTRVVLEPLRDPSYNMGQDGYWSWVWSMVFMVAGALLIFVNHVIQYFVKKKLNKPIYKPTTVSSSFKAMIGLDIASIVLLVIGIILMTSGTFTGKIAYNSFNLGLIILIMGISVLVFAFIALFTNLTAKKMELKNE